MSTILTGGRSRCASLLEEISKHRAIACDCMPQPPLQVAQSPGSLPVVSELQSPSESEPVGEDAWILGVASLMVASLSLVLGIPTRRPSLAASGAPWVARLSGHTRAHFPPLMASSSSSAVVAALTPGDAEDTPAGTVRLSLGGCAFFPFTSPTSQCTACSWG